MALVLQAIENVLVNDNKYIITKEVMNYAVKLIEWTNQEKEALLGIAPTIGNVPQSALIEVSSFYCNALAFSYD